MAQLTAPGITRDPIAFATARTRAGAIALQASPGFRPWPGEPTTERSRTLDRHAPPGQAGIVPLLQ